MTDTQHFYSVEQVASLLQLHPTTIRRLIRAGKLHAVRFGRCWHVPAQGGLK